MAKLTIAIGKKAPAEAPPPDEFEGEEEAPEDEGIDPTEEGDEPETPGEEEAEGSYPEFSIPDGLDVSDLKPGEEKEVLCTIRKTSETEACITQVDGIDLAGAGGGMTGPPPQQAGGPPPPEMLAAMMGGGGPPPPPGMGGPPPNPVRSRAAAAGLM